ncbi:MAG: DUF1284 domain-containing protein [Dongiaceae bacterium]
MLTYAGKGYTPEFIANLDEIVARINAGQEEIKLIEGPDIICGPMRSCQDHPQFHCDLPRIQARDERALAAINMLRQKLNQPPLRLNDHLIIDAFWLAQMRAAFKAKDLRAACEGCEWYDTCTEIAEEDFKPARLGQK